MSLAKVARDRGKQIARELNLRKSSELVHPQQRRLFGKALAEMVRTPDAPARARLDGLYQRVPRRRELQTAVALLDLAWRVPPSTRLEEDMVLMIRRCYLDAPQTGWRLCIRDELRDRQVHPFPNVRRVVHLVRQIDAVDEAEIAELAELERGYPDLRQSIAERIILHNQVDYLEAVITYLSESLEGKDAEEEKAAQRIFPLLAAQFEKSERALEILYRQYLSRYGSNELRGFLMLALAAYGDAIVPQLEHEHAANLKDRGPIEHVLMQIVMRGGVGATEALLAILRDARPPDLSRTCRFLSKGLATLAGHAEHTVGVTAVREAVSEALPMLKRRPLPEIRDFLDGFAMLEWGRASVDALVERVLDGTATDAHRQQLRRLARTAAQQLVAIAEDPGRRSLERRRAMEALSLLRAAANPGLGQRLWSVFLCEYGDDIRVGVLRALSALELNPGPPARGILFALLQDGSPKLAEEIRLAWSRIFPAVALTDGSVHDRGSE